MTQTLVNNFSEIEEKQMRILEDFRRELDFQLEIDPLDELLSLGVDEVINLIKDAYEYYMEEENLKPGVAKIKAMEEYTLWYHGNKEKEILIRSKLNELY